MSPTQVDVLSIWQVQAMFSEAARIGRGTDGKSAPIPTQEEFAAIKANWAKNARPDEQF